MKKFNFQAPTEEEYNYKIVDAIGRVVHRGVKKTETFMANQIELEVGLAAGGYFFVIENRLDQTVQRFAVW